MPRVKRSREIKLYSTPIAECRILQVIGTDHKLTFLLYLVSVENMRLRQTRTTGNLRNIKVIPFLKSAIGLHID